MASQQILDVETDFGSCCVLTLIVIFFSFWLAHRSDLAVEDLEHVVPELQLWKANVLGVASYFRTSKNHKATLRTLFPDAHEFPAYFEVRFAEHLVNVIEVVLHNRDGCIEVWKQISAEGT